MSSFWRLVGFSLQTNSCFLSCVLKSVALYHFSVSALSVALLFPLLLHLKPCAPLKSLSVSSYLSGCPPESVSVCCVYFQSTVPLSHFCVQVYGRAGHFTLRVTLPLSVSALQHCQTAAVWTQMGLSNVACRPCFPLRHPCGEALV